MLPACSAETWVLWRQVPAQQCCPRAGPLCSRNSGRADSRSGRIANTQCALNQDHPGFPLPQLLNIIDTFISWNPGSSHGLRTFSFLLHDAKVSPLSRFFLSSWEVLPQWLLLLLLLLFVFLATGILQVSLRLTLEGFINVSIYTTKVEDLILCRRLKVQEGILSLDEQYAGECLTASALGEKCVHTCNVVKYVFYLCSLFLA